jgi:thiol:disulfide interchange protein
MKTRILLIILLVWAAMPFAFAGDSTQAPKRVIWTFTAEKKSDQQYVLHLKGQIEAGWKLFSITMSDDNPNTRVTLDSSSLAVAKLGAITENGGLKSANEPLLDNLEIKYFENEVDILVPLTLTGKAEKISGAINYMALKGDEITDVTEALFKFTINEKGELAGTEGGLTTNAAAAQTLKRPTDINKPVNDCGGIGSAGHKSLWAIFLLGFLGGLIALVTPCVFPMIPLTVSFFTKKAENRKKGIFNASMYGFFIFLIYVLFSTPFHIWGNVQPEIFNNISTNVWLNLVFFIIFIVFALSFFGLYEIGLPAGLAGKVDSKAGAKSLFGIFFMALTLAIVSFSCTGPILGSLLVGSLNSDGGAWQLTAGMGGFGLALALPFALFAMFPRWLNSLPKSGGWLGEVKVVLGFIELALAVKFLSNADLVEHWGIIKREVFFALWIIIGILTVLYLWGKIRFKHDSPVTKPGMVRIGFIVLFAAFTIYLVPGLTKTKWANRALISGFPPPLSYSLYGHDAFKGVEPQVRNDYEKALQLSREKGKPLLIDFTGWACVNCRKMEENVWIEPEVKELIEKEFILVSLYVDDPEKLPEDQRFLYKKANGDTKKIISIGDKYATMQAETYGFVSQPLYAVVTPDEQLLSLPKEYTASAVEYAKWLRCSVEAYKKTMQK